MASSSERTPNSSPRQPKVRQIKSRAKKSGNSEGRMTLREHFIEIRRRLVISAIGIIIGAIGGWFIADWIWAALAAPINEVNTQSHNAIINYTGVSTAFDLKFQISIVVGIIISSPLWLYQLFAFFVPAMTGREKRYTFGFFFSAIPLFLAGCAAGWLVMPHIVILLTSFVPKGGASYIEAKDYLTFVLKLVVAVGIAFVLPVFLVLLNFMGILSSRSIRASWRWAILVIIVFCAIATPSADVISMFLLALPIIGLYYIAVGVTWWHDRGIAKRADALEAELAT